MNPYAMRRNAVLEAIEPGVMILPAACVAYRNNDVEHEYRQDSDVFYLTGFEEPESVVVLSCKGDKQQFVMFVRARDKERETWEGRRAGVEGAKEHYGAEEAYPITELTSKLPELLENHRRLYYYLGRDRVFDDKVLAAIRTTRRKAKHGVGWPTEIIDPAMVVHELRLHKDAEEIATIRRAAEITREGHLAAMHFAKPGIYEYEVEAKVHEVFRRHGAERHAYSPIVGSGTNATVLHYKSNRDRIQKDDLLLLDAGCEYAYYASDVTRTFPVSGHFNSAQRSIYELVLQAQLASIAMSIAGKTLEDVHQASLDVLVEGLLRLGLLEGEKQKILEEKTYKKFYMHRTSHYLGMDVHDVGFYFIEQKHRLLESGMVITIEPGLYFDKTDTTIPEMYRGIGVRIEDDVLITDKAPRVLTEDIPKTIDDLERACAA